MIKIIIGNYSTGTGNTNRKESDKYMYNWEDLSCYGYSELIELILDMQEELKELKEKLNGKESDKND